MNHVLYLSLTQAIAILTFVGIVSAWIARHYTRKEWEMRLWMNDAYWRGECRRIMQVYHTKGVAEGVRRNGLNTELAHRTDSEQRN